MKYPTVEGLWRPADIRQAIQDIEDDPVGSLGDNAGLAELCIIGLQHRLDSVQSNPIKMYSRNELKETT